MNSELFGSEREPLLFQAWNRSLDGVFIGSTGSSSLYCGNLRKKETVLFPKYYLPLMVYVGDDILQLEDLCSIFNNNRSKIRKKNVIPLWFFFSARGGIYLHESISSYKTVEGKKSFFALCVVNTDSGTVCLSPGHVKNNVLSGQLECLVRDVFLWERDAWFRQVSRICDRCIAEY